MPPRSNASTRFYVICFESIQLVIFFLIGCYGVSDVPADGAWKCQRCSQDNGKDIETSVSTIQHQVASRPRY